MELHFGPQPTVFIQATLPLKSLESEFVWLTPVLHFGRVIFYHCFFIHFRQLWKFIVPPEFITMLYWDGLRNYIKRIYDINAPKCHDKKSVRLPKLGVQVDYSHQTGVWIIFFAYTNKEANSYTLTFIWYQTNRNWLDIITLLHKNWIHPLKKQLLPEKKPIKYKRPWDCMLSSELIVGFHWHYRYLIWYLSNLNLTSSWLPASENQRWGSQEGRATNT